MPSSTTPTTVTSTGTTDPLSQHYPQTCPFCAIASAYPPHPSSAFPSSYTLPSPTDIPPPTQPSTLLPSHSFPQTYLLLSTPHVLAFLDIMPMTRGHVLLVPRRHSEKLDGLDARSAGEVGWWMPVVCRAVMGGLGMRGGEAQWNVVQNNGIRAAQVVPHVHFHIIPRPQHVPEVKARSWTMFGKGTREDLDDEEAAELVEKMRVILREEVEKIIKEGEAEKVGESSTGSGKRLQKL